jgi:hypothetical protein
MQPAMPLMVACVRLSSTTASENQAAASRNDAAPADTAAAACQAKEVPRMSETPFCSRQPCFTDESREH